MATVLIPPKPAMPAATDGSGRGGSGSGARGFGGRDGRERGGRAIPARTYRTGMWLALAAIVMLFAAFTSALIVRKGVSTDWVPTAIPRILYLNTLILLTSSLTLELARHSLAAGLGERFALWWSATTALGVAFLGGQWLAWGELAARGVYLATNPSSSFFYLLTAAHGVHLLGGVAALFYVRLSTRRIVLEPGRRPAVNVAAMYWHFMDGLWIYILLLLFVRL